MKTISDHLAEVPSPYMFGANVSVVSFTHFAEVEAALKIAVLTATLILTVLTIWGKWNNRHKPPTDL